MKQIWDKPYQYIWLAIPLILGLSLFGLNAYIDLQFHDTYLVFALFQIGLLISIVLGAIGFIYWTIRHVKLINWMTLIHVLSTMTTFALYLMIGILSVEFEADFDAFRSARPILFVISLLAIISQLIFLTNMVLSLIRNKKKT